MTSHLEGDMDRSVPERSIIISNGRCGSTLLSDLIAQEPGTLSAQEFFMSMAPWSRSMDEVSGAEYWQLVSSPREEISTLFRIGLPPKEFRYPATGRWAADPQRIPRILGITLAKLTDDPDALFDRLAEQVPAFPRQSIARQHQDFLDLLARLLDRPRWVERSGGSSQIAPFLLAGYPSARIVYLTRNWADSAKSMSRHPSFQLVQLRVEALSKYGIDPFGVTDEESAPEELRPYLPGRITAELLRRRGDDPSRYVHLCAFMSSQTEQALDDSPPEHLLTMAYEDLLLDPVGQLTRLGEFLHFDDPAGWADQVADRVKSPARSAA
jgi:putative sulfotransferase